MSKQSDYVDLQDHENHQPKPGRSKCFWITLSIISVSILAIIIFAVIGATNNNNKNNNSKNKTYVNKDGLITVNSLGRIQGNILLGDTPDDSDTWIYEFIGVRYAHPINSSNRFTPARIHNSSNTNSNTTYDATDWGNSCPQVIDSELDELFYNPVGEDCLNLNIWTPYIPQSSDVNYDGTDSDDDDSDDLLPVMLFIHGGSFVSGAGRIYNGTQLIKNGGYKVVYVSINYRLGIFGFLQLMEIYEEGTNGSYGYEWPSYGGMNGLNDQITAIKWVKQKIKSFGGDPDKITVFGESAGGLSTCMLLVTDLLDDNNGDSLIYQAMIQSGPCVGPWQPLDFVYGTYINQYALENSVYGNIANLSKLRSMSVDDLIDNVQEGDITNGFWGPTVDMHVLTANTSTTYANRDKINAHRLVWGFNSQDGLAGWPFFSGPSPKNESDYERFLSYYISDDSIVNELMTTYYPLSNFYDNASIAWYGINSDMCIQCPTFEMANDLQYKYNYSDDFQLFMYEFRGSYEPFLAPHASELTFVFDQGSLFASYYNMIFNQTLSQIMISAWNSFAQLDMDNVVGDYNVDYLSFPIDKYASYENVQVQWQTYGIGYDNNRSVIMFDNNVLNYKNYDKTYRNGACQYWANNVDISIREAICINADW